MGLLDFDDEKILRSRGIIPKDKHWRERRKQENELEDRFSELQNLGHKENSADFSDSPFAARTKLCPSCLAGLSKEDVNANCTC